MPQAAPPRKGMQNKPFWATLLILSITIVASLTWWLKGKDPDFSIETYRMEPAAFAEKVEQMVAAYTVAYEGEGKERKPVVHPLPGTDIYLPARNYNWGPILELEKGKTYRLHVATLDITHAIEIKSMHILQRLKPGKVRLSTITPTVAGEHQIICREFCGPGHYAMVGKLRVVDMAATPAEAGAGQ